MIEIKDLMLFMEVYRSRSLTQAAKAQKITQPAATFRLKKIEEEFKRSMFQRLPRGLEPTEDGRTVANYAEVITKGYNSMYDVMRLLQERDEMTTTIKVPEGSQVTIEKEEDEATQEQETPKRQILTEDLPTED
jgi:DNA-binding transcriptional LysR family regulator